MKVLVAVKRVADPDNANKIKVGTDRIDTAGLDWKLNPFDEYALEAALRLTETAQTKTREGEVVVVTLGPKEAETNLRAALATGADRAIRVETTDAELDGRLVAQALRSLVLREKPDLVLMGKQAVDGDNNYVGQALAELLDYPMATFAAMLREQADGVLVTREIDGGTATVKLRFPALVTVDLRIVAPESVFSAKTTPEHKYAEGVRFAPLPAIMKAKKKPLDVVPLSELVTATTLTSNYSRFESPPARKAGVKVTGVEQLVEKLKTEARVL